MPGSGHGESGSTVEDAIANLKEATELYLEEFPAQESFRPMLTTFDALVHA
jgi:predicted RNase H-like HicB family nuclease